MNTDDDKGADSLEDTPVKCEVKEEIESEGSDADWNSDCVAFGGAFRGESSGNGEADIKEENTDGEDDAELESSQKNTRPKRHCVEKAYVLNKIYLESDDNDEEVAITERRRKPQRRKTKKKTDGHVTVSQGDQNKNKKALRFTEQAEDDWIKEEPESEEDEADDIDDEPPRKKPKRKKDEEEWNESMEYDTGVLPRAPRKRPKKNLVPRKPEIFSTLEEFTEYMEKRVEASIQTVIEDDGEDPRVHQHFYLAVNECVDAGLKQGLVVPEEVDSIWKKWDDLAAQTFESRERKPLQNKKKMRRKGRKYIKVQKVHLGVNQYQEMLKKTRRIKTLFVRDFVLKSVEENDGENKIIDDLKVRREFFNMLLEVPGSTSKIAVLSSIRTLWKQLVYGKKEDWSKYLANKEKVLEKRKEYMDPENVKMRRYLYRQAYLSSLPKEEKERRRKVKQEYLKELRSAMSEEERQKIREKNRMWRMSLTGERRERYIERVYSAIRKRNERLKYERAGLKPPDELLPLRCGRSAHSKYTVQTTATRLSRDDKCGTRGRGRGRGRGLPRMQETSQSTTPPTAANLAYPPPIVTQPLPSTDTPNYHAASIPPQSQPILSVYPDYGAIQPSVHYFGQGAPPPIHQFQNHEYLPPLSANDHSSAVSPPLSTPPYNFSIRNKDDSNSLHHQDGFDDNDASSTPSNYCQDDSLSNTGVSSLTVSNLPSQDTLPKVISAVKKTESVKEALPSKTAQTSSLSSTPEICEECGMQFARSYDLRKHITFAHTEDETNRHCPVCGKEFNLPRSLWRHIVRHHRGNTDASKEVQPKRPTRVSHEPCKCELCGKEFLTGDIRKAYRDHMRRTHKRKQEKPPSILPEQPEGSIPKMVRCEFCDKEMLYISLRRHIRSAHRTDDAKSFACEECGKTFKERRYLTDHVRLTHSFNFHKMIESRKLLAKSYSKEDPGKEIFTCNICSENISERLQFRTHVLKKHLDVFQEISSSGAAYSRRECEVCNATFPREIELREHLTSEHPDICWSCPHCAKFYCAQASLQKHIKNIHTRKKAKETGTGTGSEENWKKCPKCKDMIEGGEAEMWVHIKAMHKEIIVYCNYCGKPKWSKKLLSDHHRLCKLRPPKTNDEKEDDSRLTCEVCGSKLKHQESLNRHMRDIHKMHKSEFKCEEPDCNEVFKQKVKLYDHLEEVHRLKVTRKKKRIRNDASSSVDEVPDKRQRKSARIQKMDETMKQIDSNEEQFSDDELQFYLKTEPE